MNERIRELIERGYWDLSIEERKEIWLAYFNLPGVEEVIAEYDLDTICSDKFIEGFTTIFIRYNLNEDEIEDLFEREHELTSYIRHHCCQYDENCMEGVDHIDITSAVRGHESSTDKYLVAKADPKYKVIYRK